MSPEQPPAGRTAVVAGLVLVAFALASVLVPQVADGLAVVVQAVHDGAHWVGTQVLAPVWQFLVDLAP
jgi:hypothetical protein